MSARDRLLRWLSGAGFDGPWAEQEADQILGDHAHELAEKIRNSEKLRDYTDDHMSDCNEAADLIDPEVE